MWYHNQTYQVASGDGGKLKRVWYIMDEVGSAIAHDSCEPNFRCAPFLYLFKGIAYSVIWPVADIQEGEIITRNFVQQLSSAESDLQMEARRLVLASYNPFNVPESFVSAFHSLTLNKQMKEIPHLKFSSPHAMKSESQHPSSKSLYSDFLSEEASAFLKETLGLKISDDPDNAEVIFVSSVTSEIIDSLDGGKWINHFNEENQFVEKTLLLQLVRNKFSNAKWFPTTYNLQSELAELIAEHYVGEYGHYWMVKASNSYRLNLKPVVTSDLTRITRMAEAGETVASRCK